MSKSKPKKQLVDKKNLELKTPASKKYSLTDSRLLGFILVLIVFLAYLPALWAGYVWDDNLVTNNPSLKTVSGLRDIWTNPLSYPEGDIRYWPMLYTSFWLEYHLWGIHPFGNHFVDVLLHALNTLLVFIILRRLSIRGAFLASAIFALHPVHVEAVAWVIERKGVLSALFFLSSFLCYLIYEKEKKTGIYLLSLFLFILALLTKMIVITLPGVILLYIWWSKKSISRQDLIRVITYIGVGIFVMAIPMFLGHKKEIIDFPVPFFGRIIIAGRAVWFYAAKLLIPVQLMTIYPRWNIDPHQIWQYSYGIAILLLLTILWHFRKKVGWGPLLLVLFFILTLSPTLGIIPFSYMSHSFVADRYQYLPSIGLIILFSAFLVQVKERLGLSKSFLPKAGMIVLFLILGILTWQQTSLYRDTETLCRDILKKNPNAVAANMNLGLTLANKGRYEEAIPYYSKALQVYPNIVKTQTNLGVALLQVGKLEEAIEHFTYVTQVKPESPGGHTNLGIAYQKQGKLEDAITQYKKTLQLDPNYPRVNFYLGDIYLQHGIMDKAIFYFSKGLQIDPNSAEVHSNLAYALVAQGRFDEGVLHYSEALQLNPNLASAHEGLAIVLTKQGKIEDAIEQYKEALRLNPNLEVSKKNLADLLAEQKTK
jgi:protein O-mannosyl-transferase